MLPVPQAGDLDVIVEPRYDTVFIPTAGTAGPLTFFAVPLGQGTSVFATASAKTLADTNMDLAGQLPAGYNFVITGFRLMPSFGMTVADGRLAIDGAVFQFSIGSKVFLRCPARTLPPGAGTYNGLAFQTAIAADLGAGWGLPTLQNTFSIARKPLTLYQTQNFQATLSWPGGVGQAVTTTLAARTTVGAAGLPITCFLDGFLKRIVQ